MFKIVFPKNYIMHLFMSNMTQKHIYCFFCSLMWKKVQENKQFYCFKVISFLSVYLVLPGIVLRSENNISHKALRCQHGNGLGK